MTELLDGLTLRQRLRSSGLTVREAVECAVQIARGLAAAHEKGIVHRDLKPENVFLTKDGGVKVLDFGLAKLRAEPRPSKPGPDNVGITASTDTGVVLGTAAYMSPEQVRAQPVDTRSDIFSLGTVLFEMLSRRRPFTGESTAELMAAILKEDPPDLAPMVKAPPSLERIVRRCLEKSPENRFHSAHDLALALEAVSGSSASGTTVVDAPARASRRRWVVLTVSLLLPLALGLAFLAGRRTARSPSPSYRQLTFRRGTVLSARFAPDGRSVVYSARWDGSLLERDVLDPPGQSGLEATRLAGGGGRRHGRRRDGRRGRGRDARAAPLSMEAPFAKLRVVVRDADWTAAGSGEFALVRAIAGRQAPGVSRGQGSCTRPMARDRSWAPPLSERRPDRVRGTGRASPARPRLVAVVDLGGRLTTLSTVWGDIEGLAWSPDGNEVSFTGAKAGSARALYAVSLSGRERLVQRVPGRLTLYDISRDGRVLLAGRARTSGGTGTSGGRTPRRGASPGWTGTGSTVVVSADGRTLVFGEAGEGGGPRGSVYLRREWRAAGPARRSGGRSPGPVSPTESGSWPRSSNSPGYPSNSSRPERVSRLRSPRVPSATSRGRGSSLTGSGSPSSATRPGAPHASSPRTSRAARPGPSRPRTRRPTGEVFTADGRYVAASPRVWPPAFKLYPTDGGEPRPTPGSAAATSRRNGAATGGSCSCVTGAEPRRELIDLSRGREDRRAERCGRPWPHRTPQAWRMVDLISLSSDGQSYAFTFVRTLSDLYLVEGLR